MGSGGFGVPVVYILSTPSTPACTPFGASMRLNPSKAFAFSGHGVPVQILDFLHFVSLKQRKKRNKFL
jgi:hypothetical protein